MKINVYEVYKLNGLTDYDCFNNDEYEKKYNSKERHMWEFTLVLIQMNPDKFVYDNENKDDIKYLKEHAIRYFKWSTPEDFTLDEWFDYMKDKSNFNDNKK